MTPINEYSAPPNQQTFRLRGDSSINNLGIRGPNFSAVPSSSRVVVFGDSIVFGGIYIPYLHLASTYLESILNENSFGTEVINVSAGSWGPGNWLGWAKSHGFFNSSRLLLVISSHDATDVQVLPTSLDTCTQPERLPHALFYYFFKCKLIRRIVPLSSHSLPLLSHEHLNASAMRDLRSFLLSSRDLGLDVNVLQFLSLNELKTGIKGNGYYQVKSLLSGLDVASLRYLSRLFRVCAIL